MFKIFNRLLYVLTVFLMALPLVSCGGGGSGGGISGTPGGTTGTLSISLTDAPAGYEAIYVTIEDVKVIKSELDDNVEENWDTVATLNQTINLLELVGGIIRDLGVAELEEGHYNQMRLKLSKTPDGTSNIFDQPHLYPNYLILEGEEDQIMLKVPSGFQSGIKIVKGFDIIASGSTELVLDFDALKSIVQAGNSGNWLLKPTIKVIESVTYSVEGTVDAGAGVPLEGAAVSSQVLDIDADDPKDEIASASGTLSNADGSYFMYLPITQNTFNIVATMEGYLPECQLLDATTTGVMAYEDYNFTLTPTAATGTLTGSATGIAITDGSATFSIRQELGACGWVEVASASVVNSTTVPATYFDPITLPEGPYEVVVSAEGEVTQVWTIDVAGDVQLDTYFPTTSVVGIVVDEGAVPLEVASISVQGYDPFAVDAKDQLAEVLATVTDATGAYFSYLPTDQSSYNVVAKLDGYSPKCDIAIRGQENPLNFILSLPAETGTLSGSVTGLATADSALFSIRQVDVSCGIFEVATASVANTVTPDPLVYFDPITLPIGTYEVVVSADGDTTKVLSVDVVAGANTLDVVFP